MPTRSPSVFASAGDVLARSQYLTAGWLVLELALPEAELLELRKRYDSLSEREQEVMALVVAGRLNKQVGAELGISVITVKAHRGRMMRKMGADSLAELVTMAIKLRLSCRQRTGVAPLADDDRALVGGILPGAGDDRQRRLERRQKIA